MDSLLEVSIEDEGRGQRPRRVAVPSKWLGLTVAVACTFIFALLAWQLLRTDAGDSPEAATTSTTVAATTTQSSSLTDPSPRPLAAQAAWIDAAGLLRDGAVVTVTAESPYLTQADPGLALCRRGRTVACTNLETGPVTFDGDMSSVSVTLMQRFVDWRGNEQDCITTAPCELRMWAFGTQIDELNVAIDFDPSAPLLQSRQSVGEDRLLEAVGDLNLTLPTDRALTVRQCIVGLNNACAADTTIPASPLTTSDTHAEYQTSPRRRMITPRGPHDCVTDGPCELRFTTDDSQRIAPFLLDFQANEIGPDELPTLAVRPAVGLAERELVEIRIGNTAAAIASLWLCAPTVPTCILLTTASTNESTVLSVPRYMDDRYDSVQGETVLDCALTKCVIQAALGGMHVSVPVTFDSTRSSLPEAQIVLDSTGPFQSGDDVRLVGRNLYVSASPNDPFTGTRIRFCESSDATPYDCISASGFSSGIERDGTVDTVLRIPDFDSRRSIPTGAVVPQSFCIDACWLIVETRLEVPGVAIPIDIVNRG
jgi:hypothetical protein